MDSDYHMTPRSSTRPTRNRIELHQARHKSRRGFSVAAGDEHEAEFPDHVVRRGKNPTPIERWEDERYIEKLRRSCKPYEAYRENSGKRAEAAGEVWPDHYEDLFWKGLTPRRSSKTQAKWT